jgi:hypothetical protein
MKGFFVALIALFCGFYLLNPTWGLVELIPDNFPIVGNLDEATAAAVLIACLRYFGFDVTRFWRRKLDRPDSEDDSTKHIH